MPNLPAVTGRPSEFFANSATSKIPKRGAEKYRCAGFWVFGTAVSAIDRGLSEVEANAAKHRKKMQIAQVIFERPVSVRVSPRSDKMLFPERHRLGER